MDHPRAVRARRCPDHPRSPQLNAAPDDQIRLLDVQALDTRIGQLEHRRANLPEHAELRKAQSQLDQQRDLLVAAETEVGDTEREQTKAEADVEQVRRRAERDQQRLDSGAVTNPRDLENLQSEIVSLARRQDDLETVALEVMERREAAAERARELASAVEGLAATATELTARRDAAVQELEAEAGTARRERGALAAVIPDDLLALYDKLRENNGGIGAAKLYQKRCEGCRLELNITELNEVRAAPADAVVRCENCRRILVRTPQSGL